MKLNNKGFAISTILYGLLALLILILMLTFEIMRTGSNNSKDLGSKVYDYLEGNSGCRDARVKYNNCIGTCATEEADFNFKCDND